MRKNLKRLFYLLVLVGVLGQYIRGLQGSVKSNSDLNAPISTKCN